MRGTRWLMLMTLGSLGLLVGCGPTGESPPSASVCGEDGNKIESEADGTVCFYDASKIVIETGFSCPSAVPNRIDLSNDLFVCAQEESLTNQTWDKIDEKTDPKVTPPDQVASNKLDMLWVIDNSQSMCQEQEQLRANSQRFIETFRENKVDFHLAVTTTHFNSWSFEAVAEPGQIQSTPHPPVGFADSCRFGSDGGDLLDPNHPQGPDYTPVQKQIEAAVACTKNPDDYQELLDWSDDEIECALYGNQFGDPGACERAGKSENEFAAEQLFPCGHEKGKRCNKQELKQIYRDIPKVLKASDYKKEDGKLDVQRLRRDWACMSYVGTRGHHYEQGLQAAVKAVSPEMTGGTVENPTNTDAPNHGFLRKDAKTAVTFVTDENDCSHSGDAIQSKARQNSCGELNCYAPTKNEDQSPLLSTDKMADDFMSNLAESKGVDSVAQEDVYVASIHGDRQRFSRSLPTDGNGNVMCESQQTELQESLVVCRTPLGSAKSGDRYEDFLRNFDNIYPKRNEQNPQQPLDGAMCAPTGDIGQPLEGIAEAMR